MAVVHRNEVARLLTLSAATTLVLGSVLASAIANNDFGWRVILFAQMAALLWTCNVLLATFERARRAPAALSRMALVPRPLTGLLWLGLAASLHDTVMLRTHLLVNRGHPEAETRDAAVDHDLRSAYVWLARHIPRSEVVQHNPDRIRAYGFGLYGRNPIAVSDLHSAPLFGADPAAVEARLIALGPVFKGALPPADVQRRLATTGVAYVVVTTADPAWARRATWVFGPRAVFATDNVRILRVADLGPDRRAGVD
jgi:hypothetical protein